MNRVIADTPNDLAERLDRLAGELDAAGVLTDPAWRAAFYALPRHLFIPARAWVLRDGRYVELDRDRDPDSWWDAVYSVGQPIITQFNDGEVDGPPASITRAIPSSSCPDPNVQFRLLHELAVGDGMRVLEVGTGTGWNAALLAHRLGDSNVTTVEVDPGIADQAIQALTAAGYAPSVERADGSLGYPLHAPYDRVIATCSVSTVPHAWVAQTRPGGLIVTPWVPPAGTGFLGGPLARLEVGRDATATGKFVGNVGFMPLRQQRRSDGQPPPGIKDPAPTGTATSTTTINPVALLFGRIDTAFPALLSLGEGTYDSIAKGVIDDVLRLYIWLSDPASGSWARIQVRGPFDFTPFPVGVVAPVEQYGPRRLWDEIEAVHRWWQGAGKPGLPRFGLTVRPDGQVVWLDSPAQPIFVLPSAPTPRFVSHER
jgi:protein-L-isoaspartate O-methyltransferase